MRRRLPLFAFGIVSLISASMALRAFAAPGGDAGGPPNGPPPPGGAPGFHLLPRFVEEKLDLTDDQQQQYDALEQETKAKLEAILTPAQIKIMKETRPPHHGPGGAQGRQGGGKGGGKGGDAQGGNPTDGQGGPPPPPQN